MNYQPTTPEKEISRLYVEKSILTPSDLTLENICMTFGINLCYNPKFTYFYEKDNFNVILIKADLPPKLQKEKVLRILSQYLLLLEDPYKLLDKKYICYHSSVINDIVDYLALPYHMLTQYNLDHPNIIKLLSTDFKIAEAICKSRIKTVHDHVNKECVKTINSKNNKVTAFITLCAEKSEVYRIK